VRELAWRWNCVSHDGRFLPVFAARAVAHSRPATTRESIRVIPIRGRFARRKRRGDAGAKVLEMVVIGATATACVLTQQSHVHSPAARDHTAAASCTSARVASQKPTWTRGVGQSCSPI